jgi:hypothetical protein
MNITDNDVRAFLDFCAGKLYEGAETALGSSPAASVIHEAAGDLVRTVARGHKPPQVPRVRADWNGFDVVVGANAYLCRTWARMLRRPIRDVAAASEEQREQGARVLEQAARLMECAAGLQRPDVVRWGEDFWRTVLRSKQRVGRVVHPGVH